MSNKESQAGAKAEQRTNAEVTKSSHSGSNTNVVRCIGLSFYLGLLVVVSILFNKFCQQNKVSDDVNIILSYLIGVAFGLGLIVFWRNWLEEFV